ncbi:MAG: DUF421 domain-containing protein [Ruminococcaceae bacterium]|nr:DUF421 domain-containing protein [Oscillospiraceae bacterium]
MFIVLIRTLIIFTLLLFFLRILGKRQLGELEISELIVSVLVADMACLPLQDIGIPLINALVPIAAILSLELLLSEVSLRSVKLRGLLWGKPCFLIEKGKIQEKALRENRFSLDELCEELRRQSITDIAAVDYAVLETDGTLNVILVPDMRPVTAGQLGLTTEDSGYAHIIINDGRLIRENLRLCGRDERWLQKELHRRNIKSHEDVFFMSVNDAGEVYFAGKEYP